MYRGAQTCRLNKALHDRYLVLLLRRNPFLSFQHLTCVQFLCAVLPLYRHVSSVVPGETWAVEQKHISPLAVFQMNCLRRVWQFLAGLYAKGCYIGQVQHPLCGVSAARQNTQVTRSHFQGVWLLTSSEAFVGSSQGTLPPRLP